MSQIGSVPSLIGSQLENLTSSPLQSGRGDLESRVAAVGKEFEGVFLSLMLKEMRSTLENDGFFGTETSDTYGGLFDMFIGQDLASTSPLGIAEILLESYVKHRNLASVGDEANYENGNSATSGEVAITA